MPSAALASHRRHARKLSPDDDCTDPDLGLNGAPRIGRDRLLEALRSAGAAAPVASAHPDSPAAPAASQGPPSMRPGPDAWLTDAVGQAARALQVVDRESVLLVVAAELTAMPPAAVGLHRTIVTAMLAVLAAPPDLRRDRPRHWVDARGAWW